MKRALLVGIDEYQNLSDLAGCVNDVDALGPLLSRHEDGGANFECQRRTSRDGPVTRDRMLGDFDALLAGGADVALAYFAGHGAAGAEDVVLATSDGTGPTPGVALSELVGKIARSLVKEIILILDCCFSGAAGGVPQLGGTAAAVRPGLALLAASRADQTAAETPHGRGQFSTYLCGGLEGGAADVLGHVTVAGLYSYLDESFGAWEQRPVFKANIERLHNLRSCKPAVSHEELRQLPDLFPTPEYDYPLDPSYEPEAEPQNPEHEAVFRTLQNYNRAKLLGPVGEEHMYFAAVHSTSCRLTLLGQHYRQLAGEERI